MAPLPRQIREAAARRLSLVLLAACAAGAHAATFVVDNVGELRQEAYRAAFDQARQRAARLAVLAGAELGEVLSVQETVVPNSDTKNPQVAMVMAMWFCLTIVGLRIWGITEYPED